MLEIDGADSYSSNGALISPINISGVVNPEATISATATNEGDIAGDSIDLIYDIWNTDLVLALDDLA